MPTRPTNGRAATAAATTAVVVTPPTSPSAKAPRPTSTSDPLTESATRSAVFPEALRQQQHHNLSTTTTEAEAAAVTEPHHGTRRSARRRVGVGARKTTATTTAVVAFGPITEHNVEVLRKLNLRIFPVRYNDTFYGDVLFTPEGYSKFAYWDGLVVGAICCRHEPLDDHPVRQRTYIMTLGVLEPYRQYRIGSALLQSVIAASQENHVDHIYLHVQTSNDTALRFYRQFGFTVTETIRNYYKRIEPPDCFVLVKRLDGDGK